jgi:hypothetical protein
VENLDSWITVGFSRIFFAPRSELKLIGQLASRDEFKWKSKQIIKATLIEAV